METLDWANQGMAGLHFIGGRVKNVLERPDLFAILGKPA